MTVIPKDNMIRPDEPPPSYTPVEPTAVVDAGTFRTKPTNFLVLSSEHDSIKGEFVIDPSIRIPSSLLDKSETETERKNLCLRSKSSSVHADIWLLATEDGATDGRKRTTIALDSEHGSIDAQLHALSGAAPFFLRAEAQHGTVRLALPASFQGLITLSTRHGSMSISEPLMKNVTQLGQLGEARRYFVGDLGLLGEEEWKGDQIEVESTHGSIRMRYVDETVVRQKSPGLLSRLFGS